MSPHGVRLSGAPGAPLCIGCSSANRALAGKLLWDGIVAVPEVFGAGASLSPRYEGCGRPGLPGAFRLIPLACGHTATHGGTLSVVAIAEIWRHIKAARINSGPEGLYRVDGPSGFTQAAENHGRTISERHNRNPQRRTSRA